MGVRCTTFYALLLVVSTLQWSSVTLADGVIQPSTAKYRPTLPGKPSTFTTYFGCFQWSNGTPINCSFTLKIDGLKEPQFAFDNNGGHFHFTNRPLSLNNKPLQHDGDLDPSAFGVAGFTSLDPSQEWGVVAHETPETSGKLAGESTLVTLGRFQCSLDCFTSTSWRWEDTYDIGVRNLAELPGRPSEYLKVRNPDTNHPDSVAFNGAPLALQMLPLIAQRYFELSKRLLSVNDMSLIKGGLFDCCKEPWMPPHSAHREGKDADINQGGVGCDQDGNLQTAVDQFLKKVKTPNGNLRSALYCEPSRFCEEPDPDPDPETKSKCLKHIDFE